MEELYIEGLANHDDPESCAGTCEGVGEALTGADAGRVLSSGMSRRKTKADVFSGKQTHRGKSQNLVA